MSRSKKNGRLLLVMAAFSLTHPGCSAQPTFGADQLQLSKTVLLPGVRGRIDHLEVNLKDGLIYVAALGNNTLEVVDIASGKVIHNITGYPANEVWACAGASGDGPGFQGNLCAARRVPVEPGREAEDIVGC